MPTDRPIHEVLPAALSRRTLLAAAAASSASALLAACGGGGSDEPETATATASSYTDGVIAGFGSVIVGGVRFDDTKATLSTEEGTALAAGALRLGMTVEIDSGRVDRAAASALALRIRLNSELLGPVGAVDAAAVFDERLAGGFAGLAPGQAVEVYAEFDAASQRYRATRVEPATAGSTLLRLRGPVAEVSPLLGTLPVKGILK